jgi:hypothetical protein
MQVEWSIIPRVKKYIGEINYEKDLGIKFESLLEAHKFDEAGKMLDNDKIIRDSKIKNILIKHVESYEYAC